MSNPRSPRLRLVPVLCAVGLACLGQPGESAAEEVRATSSAEIQRFDIPAGELAQVLLSIVRQSRTPIAFDQHLVEGLPAPAIQGSYSVEQALQRALQGSGLEYSRSAAGVLSLQRATAPDAALPAAKPAGTLATVVVTGTRKADVKAGESLAPIDVVSAEQLRDSGSGDLRDALVRGNRIVGNRELRVAERGNGVTLWNTPGTRVLDNDISAGRDGIFVNTSRLNTFSGNRFHDLRYAVHYMYTNESEISGNVATGTDVAYAIMFSHQLIVRDNVAVDSREQGLMLNYANHSRITDNSVDRAGKCVFIYNANYNEFQDNRFANCDIGVHFTAGSEGNQVSGNAFINNRNQVKYVSTRTLDWSVAGRGNYWSDNTAFDLDGDGIADTAYRPNGVVDQLLWRAPAARILLNSPSIAIVRWAQSQFPAILPGGVIDSAPLMQPPPLPARLPKESP